MRRPQMLAALLVVWASACTATTPVSTEQVPSTAPPTSIDPPRTQPATPSVREILELVQTLAAGGPREATSVAYRRAAGVVEAALRDARYRVSRQAFDVPAGISWGIDVGSGASFNVVARPPGLDGRRPYLIVGAHLDTVPQSPGANDNAAGVAMLVALSRAAAGADLAVPVVFVAFGAEEPRGPGDQDHHFGSRRFVARLPAANGLIGMLSLDRIGIGSRLRICTGGVGPRSLARFLLAGAEAVGVPAISCRNRASDHWSFERAGYPAARLLGADDPDYHTPRDRPRVLERAQLARAARLLWDALQRLRPGDLG